MIAALGIALIAAAGQPSDATRSADPADAARETIAASPALVHGVPGDAYQVVAVVPDPDGAAHVRFARTWHGLPVLGGDFVVHVDPQRAVTDVTTASRHRASPTSSPRVSRAAAIRIAGETVGDAHLVVDARTRPARLLWEVEGTASGRRVRVDAASGVLVETWDGLLHEAGTGHSLYNRTVPLTTERTTLGYVLHDPSRGGISTRDALHTPLYGYHHRAVPLAVYPDFVDPDNVWGNGAMTDRQTVAVDAQYGLARTWDYFLAAHRYAGIDGKGAPYHAVVHRGPVAQASWSGECDCAFFGDGDGVSSTPFVPLDVVAHEMTHGIIGKTARLDWSGEPRALQESISDAFGALVEFSARSAGDQPDYTQGERTTPSGTPHRYMDDPARRFGVGCWSDDAASMDPYRSSGIASHAFYLVAVGSGKTRWGNSGTCNGAPAVRGIGNAAAGRIWFRALTVYLASTSGFHGMRDATVRAARDIYGAGSPQHRTTIAAWRAVGVVGAS